MAASALHTLWAGLKGHQAFDSLTVQVHSMLESRASKSLSPASRTVMVDTENGLPQAMPSSRFTIAERYMVTSG